MVDLNHPDIGDVANSRYYKGTIVSVESGDDTAVVSLPGIGSVGAVIFYHCSTGVDEAPNGSLPGSAAAFAEDDEVIVIEKDGLFKVMGFADGIKRPCLGIWQFHMQVDGVNLKPSDLTAMTLSLKTYSLITNVLITPDLDDLSNSDINISERSKFPPPDSGKFAPAVVRSISYDVPSNLWTIDMDPSPDDILGVAEGSSGGCIETNGNLLTNYAIEMLLFGTEPQVWQARRTESEDPGVPGTGGFITVSTGPNEGVNHMTNQNGSERLVGTFDSTGCGSGGADDHFPRIVPGLYYLDFPAGYGGI